MGVGSVLAEDFCASLAAESPLASRLPAGFAVPDVATVPDLATVPDVATVPDAEAPRYGAMLPTSEPQPQVLTKAVTESPLPGGGSRTPAQLAAASTGFINGMDALRAFAILGVVAYHLIPTALPGGYLGVDIFFVLSGFLITRGLASTMSKRGVIDLREFFQRRFNRIVPSLVVVLTLCTTIGLAVGGDVLVGVNRQIYGALSFTSNWVTIAAGGDYFAATTPALFANLWYLALDVQYYLLWAPVLVLLYRFVKPQRLWLVPTGIGLGSAALMLGLSFTGGLNHAVSQTRMYEGTDTHFFSLMFGSALALGLAYNGAKLQTVAAKLDNRKAGQLGWLLGCALVVLFFTLQWTSLASFRGLMVLASVLSVGILYLLVNFPTVGAVLERQPWQWIGKHSYGIFLWHWPLLVILSAAFKQRYTEAPWWLLTMVLAASAVLTWYTEKLINIPVGNLGLRGYFGHIWGLPRLARAGVAGIVVVGLAGTTAAAATAPTESLITRQIMAGAAQAALSQQLPTTGQKAALANPAQTTAALRKAPRHQETVWGLAVRLAPEDDVTIEYHPRLVTADPTGDNVTAVGDSVLLGATPQLMEQLPGVYVDGAISRQFYQATPILQDLKEAGELRPYVLVALATNGTIATDWIDQLMDVVGPDRIVLFVNGYGNRSWIPEANAQLEAATQRYPGQVFVADWNSIATADASLLGGDGIHPNDDGMAIYAQLVVDTLNSIGK